VPDRQGLSGFSLVTGVSATVTSWIVAVAIVSLRSVAIGWGKFPGWEGDPTKQLTGIFRIGAGGVGAFFAGDRVLQERYYHLGIPLQTNNGELPQRHKKPTVVMTCHQIFIKQLLNAFWDLRAELLRAMITVFGNLAGKYHGLENFYNCGGSIGCFDGGAVGAAKQGVGGKDVGPAVLSAEHSSLGEDGDTAQCGGSATSNHSIGKDPIEESHIHTVVIPVEGYRLHIDICIHEVCTAYPDTGCLIQHILAAFGEVNSQVFDAILIPAGVSDLSGVYGKGAL
jgi:hypothetical protein